MEQDLSLVTTAPEEEQGSLIQIVQLPIIKERLHQIKPLIQQKVAYADTMIVTEENLQEAKKYRAELNALLLRGETERKETKNAIIQPYMDFEPSYNDCFGSLLKDAIKTADEKINPVENGIKARCEESLRAFFYEYADANGIAFLKYEQAGIVVSMADAKAKTQPPKKLRDQIEKFILRVCMDVDMILNLENAPEILAEYKQTLNATLAISNVTERHQKIAEANAEQEQRNTVKTQEEETARKFEAFAPPVVSEPAPPQVETLTVKFAVTDTRERLKLLKHWLDANGYKYT